MLNPYFTIVKLYLKFNIVLHQEEMKEKIFFIKEISKYNQRQMFYIVYITLYQLIFKRSIILSIY